MSGLATTKILGNFGLILCIVLCVYVPNISSQTTVYLPQEIYTTQEGSFANISICHSPPDADTSIDVSTRNVTAFAGLDFVGTNHTITIPADTVCISQFISIFPDTLSEATEVFYVDVRFSQSAMSATVVIIEEPFVTVDVVSPIVTCTGNVVEFVSSESSGAMVQFTEPSATDDSGLVQIFYASHRPGQFFTTGVTAVTYTFIDPSGNRNDCSFHVFVVEGNTSPTPPTCPSSTVTVTTHEGIEAAIATSGPFTCTDTEQGGITASCSPDSGRSIGTFTVTCTCTDDRQLQSSCSFVVAVVESSPKPVSTTTATTLELNSTPMSTTTPPTHECEVNECPNGERCLRRQGVNVTDFVCECKSGPRLSYGPTCDEDFTFFPSSNFLPCYGQQCSSGNLHTRNFPKNYDNGNLTMMIVYVPGALRFDFSFLNQTFGVEYGKDNLLIGHGLKPSIPMIPSNISEKEAITEAFFFHGYKIPDDFSIESDAFFVYWRTDSTVAFSGFNLSWTSVAIEVECPPSFKESIPSDNDTVQVFWEVPTVRSGVGNNNLIVHSNFEPGHIFGISNNTIQYTFEDSFGHSTRCAFGLTVEESSPKPVSTTTASTPVLNQILSFNELDVENSISSNSITLLLQEVDTQNGPISCYEFVVVKRSEGQSGGGSPDEEVPFDQVKSEPEDGLPYRSIVMTHEEYIKRESITIGSDGLVTRCFLPGNNSRRKRTSNIVTGNQELVATNSPLESSTKYDIFMRTYTPIGNGMFQYASSGYVTITTNKIGGGEGGSNSSDGISLTVVIYAAVIIIVIIGVVVFLMVAGVLYVRLRKTHKNRDGNVRQDAIYANEVFVQESSEANNSKGRDTLSYETVENLERKDRLSYENVRSSRPSESPMWKQLAKQTKNRTRKEISRRGIKETSLNRTCERNLVGEANNDCVIYEEMPEDSSNYDQAVYVTDEAPLPFKVSELPKYVNKKKFQKSGLEREFKLLPQGQHHPWTIATKTENNHLNHHPTILPYDHSRVKLIKLPGIPSSDYYNASFIMDQKNRQAFIAVQGPHKNTEDFLRLIWQEKISVVVMVTPLEESGKKLCSKYWPSRVSEISSFGNMSVTLTSEQQYPDYFIRQLTVHPKSKSPVNVLQFHFPCWPYMGVPKKLSAVIRFIRDIKEALQETHLPILVHCSDGCGASGTLIGAFCLMDDLEEDEICVYEFVKKMRNNRVNMVQTKGQYIFLYDILLKAYLMPHSELSAKHLKSMTIGKNSFTKEFQALSNPKYNAAAQSGASAENQGKNRFANKIPLDVARPQLKCSSLTGGNNYINACFVNSYQDKNAILMTQSPLPTTVEDFWRLIIDVQCSTIVMLNETDSSGSKGCVCYWPNGGNVQYGNILVTCVNTKNEDAHVYRQFKVTHQNQKSSVLVDHFQLPTSPQTNITIWRDFIRSIGCEACAGPTVVHCIDGCGHSGVFVTVLNELQRLKQKQRVNVFETVQELRDSNPHTMQTLEQYSLCYEILQGLTDEN